MQRERGALPVDELLGVDLLAGPSSKQTNKQANKQANKHTNTQTNAGLGGPPLTGERRPEACRSWHAVWCMPRAAAGRAAQRFAVACRPVCSAHGAWLAPVHREPSSAPGASQAQDAGRPGASWSRCGGCAFRFSFYSKFNLNFAVTGSGRLRVRLQARGDLPHVPRLHY